MRRTPIPLLQLLLVKVGRLLQLLQLVVWELLGLSGVGQRVSDLFAVSSSAVRDSAGLQGVAAPPVCALNRRRRAMASNPPRCGISGTGDAGFSRALTDYP